RVHAQIVQGTLVGVADLCSPNLQMAGRVERPGQVVFENLDFLELSVNVHAEPGGLSAPVVIDYKVPPNAGVEVFPQALLGPDLNGVSRPLMNQSNIIVRTVPQITQ